MTLRALLRTVVELLKAVLNLLVVVLLALFEGLKSLGQSAGKGVSAIGDGIVGGLKKLAQNSLKGLAGQLIPDTESTAQGDQQLGQRA